MHDMLGLFTEFTPKHAKRYADLGQAMKDAFCQYAEEVRDGTFPTDKHSFTMDQETLRALTVLR